MRTLPSDPQATQSLPPALFHILLALADGEEQHGYSIMQEIAAQTQGMMHIGPTILYRSIKRMLEDGHIVESDERPDPALDDARRRYYRLTDLGRRATVAEMKHLEQLLALARRKTLLRTIAPLALEQGA